MIPFCDNRLCRLHSVQIRGPEFDVVRYVEANGKLVESKRKLIYNKNRRTIFALCEICAYVVAMINEAPKAPPEPKQDPV